MNYRKLAHAVCSLLLVAQVVLTGCSGAALAPAPAPQAPPAAATRLHSPALAATATLPPPTATALPSPTLVPTSTPLPPTATSPATATPAPSETSAPASSTPTPASAPGKTTGSSSAAPTGEKALALLVDANQAGLTQPAFRMTLTASNGPQRATQLYEFVKPGSYHIVTDEMEVIIVPGKGTFFREASEWSKSELDLSELVSAQMAKQDFAGGLKNAGVKEIRYEGTETLKGRPMWVYAYTAKREVEGVDLGTGDYKIWIGVRDKLPYRSEVTVSSEDLGTTFVNSEFEYGPGIKIDAPEE